MATYRTCVADANTQKQELEDTKVNSLRQIHELIKQSDQVIKLVSWDCWGGWGPCHSRGGGAHPELLSPVHGGAKGRAAAPAPLSALILHLAAPCLSSPHVTPSLQP